MSFQRQIYSQVWDKTFHECHIPKLEAIRKLVSRIECDTIIDLGCGDGKVSRLAVGDKFTLVGIDISEDMVRVARTSLDHVVLADLETSIPLRSGVVSLYLGIDIIEHLVNTDNFLLEINRSIDSSGRLILVTPNLASFVERILLLLGYQPQNVEVSRVHKFGSFRKTPPVGHFRGFTLTALEEILCYYGFKVLETGSTTYYGFMLKYLDLFLGRLRKSLGSLLIVVAGKV